MPMRAPATSRRAAPAPPSVRTPATTGLRR
jgi:hypothetical protein